MSLRLVASGGATRTLHVEVVVASEASESSESESVWALGRMKWLNSRIGPFTASRRVAPFKRQTRTGSF